MSRVKGVVNNRIMVHIHDLVPGDVLSLGSGEGDPIIDEILVDGNKRKIIYKPRANSFVNESLWLDPDIRVNNHIFIHDLKRERFELMNTDSDL